MNLIKKGCLFLGFLLIHSLSFSLSTRLSTNLENVLFSNYQFNDNQDTSIHFVKKYKLYKVKVKLNTKNIINGYLHEVNDSSIVVSSLNPMEHGFEEQSNNIFTDIEIKNIKSIKLNKNGFGGLGMLIGGGIGVAIGVTIFVSAGGGVVIGAIIGGAIGIPIGLGIGRRAGKTRYSINGNLDKYIKIKHKLQKRSTVENDFNTYKTN